MNKKEGGKNARTERIKKGKLVKEEEIRNNEIKKMKRQVGLEGTNIKERR